MAVEIANVDPVGTAITLGAALAASRAAMKYIERCRRRGETPDADTVQKIISKKNEEVEIHFKAEFAV